MKPTAQDLELGNRMADSLERVYVASGQIRPMIGEQIAKGIAIGRQQGLEVAARVLETELPGLANKIRQAATHPQGNNAEEEKA